MQVNSPKYDLQKTANQVERGEFAVPSSNFGVSDETLAAYFKVKELEKSNPDILSNAISNYRKRNPLISHSFNSYFAHLKVAEKLPASSGNFAFIDMQNIFKEVSEAGWKINWKAFRKYLWNNGVTKAFVFIGYLKENEGLYYLLKNAGYDLKFREVRRLKDGKIDGGNCDADLAFLVANCKTEYAKAIIVADDGDYSQMLGTLHKESKLEYLLSPHSIENTSEFIKNQIPLNFIKTLDSIRDSIEYKKTEMK